MLAAPSTRTTTITKLSAMSAHLSGAESVNEASSRTRRPAQRSLLLLLRNAVVRGCFPKALGVPSAMWSRCYDPSERKESER